MGLNDCLYPNKHRWSWGFSQKRCHKFDWYGSEPVYHASGDWNCGAFWETYQYHWHVDSCVQRNYYVCEMAQVWMFSSIYRNWKVLFLYFISKNATTISMVLWNFELILLFAVMFLLIHFPALKNEIVYPFISSIIKFFWKFDFDGFFRCWCSHVLITKIFFIFSGKAL